VAVEFRSQRTLSWLKFSCQGKICLSVGVVGNLGRLCTAFDIDAEVIFFSLVSVWIFA
jgi:hypothetical protein